MVTWFECIYSTSFWSRMHCKLWMAGTWTLSRDPWRSRSIRGRRGSYRRIQGRLPCPERPTGPRSAPWTCSRACWLTVPPRARSKAWPQGPENPPVTPQKGWPRNGSACAATKTPISIRSRRETLKSAIWWLSSIFGPIHLGWWSTLHLFTFIMTP